MTTAARSWIADQITALGDLRSGPSLLSQADATSPLTIAPIAPIAPLPPARQ